ncbi:MAG TPA: hypothetical protein VGM97_03130 [Steroidobacteraceae bacterium]
MREFMTFCCLVLLAATAAAQQPAVPATAKIRGASAAVPSIQSGSLTPSGLNTDNLNYVDDIKRIFVGDFEHVSIKRDSTNFTLMVDTYMTEYSKSCAKYLPKEKVQIMQTICTNQVATVNQFGTEVDARRCTQYNTVGTGRYADPRVYALHKTLDSSVNVAVLQAYIHDLVPNAGNGTGLRQMTDIGTYVLQDGAQFLMDNACAAPATMRYQENLLHFGRGEAPIRMPGAAQALRAVTLAKQQNYKGLVNDLITEESKAWAANRYLGGSAQVTAVNHNSDGTTPKEIDAKYSLGDRTTGKVRITFAEDESPCLYFSDAPTNCRIPNPKLLSAFRRNKYADPAAPTYPEIEPFDDAPGWVDARAKAFQRVQDNVAAANARRAAGIGPGRPANAPVSAASAASAVRSTGVTRAGAQFRITANMVDTVDESNGGSGAEFRATVVRSQGPSNLQVPVGAVVYMKVTMDQKAPGTRNAMDTYSLVMEKVEVDGRAIPLQAKPLQFMRRPSAALNAGTVLNFDAAQP